MILNRYQRVGGTDKTFKNSIIGIMLVIKSKYYGNVD